MSQAECILLGGKHCSFSADTGRGSEGKIPSERWDLVWVFLALWSGGHADIIVCSCERYVNQIVLIFGDVLFPLPALEWVVCLLRSLQGRSCCPLQ